MADRKKKWEEEYTLQEGDTIDPQMPSGKKLAKARYDNAMQLAGINPDSPGVGVTDPNPKGGLYPNPDWVSAVEGQGGVQQVLGQGGSRQVLARGAKVIKPMDGMRDYSNKWQYSAKDGTWIPATTTVKSAVNAATAGGLQGLYGLANVPSDILGAGPDASKLVLGRLRNAITVEPNQSDAAAMSFNPATTAEKYIRSGATGYAQGLPLGLAGATGGLAGGLTGEFADQTYNPDGNNQLPRVLGNAVGGLAAAVPAGLTAAGSFRNQVLRAIPGRTSGEKMAYLNRAYGNKDFAASNGLDVTIGEASNNPAIQRASRIVENHPETTLDARDYFSRRPAQVQNVLEAASNRIVPGALADPRLTGADVQTAARGALSDARRFASTQSTPSMTAARVYGDIPANPEINDNPIFKDAISAINKNPEYGILSSPEKYSQPYFGDSASYAAVQNGNPAPKAGNWSMDRLIAATKYLKEKGDAFGNPMSESYSPTAAANYGGLNSKLRSYMSEQVPDYAIGNRLYSSAASKQLDPRANSLIGEIANTASPTAQASSFLNPDLSNPSVVSSAAKDIKVRDPEAYQGLVKNHIASNIEEALRPRTGDADQFSGARFARQMGGDQQLSNLEAMFNELPQGPAKWQGFNNMLESLRMTGNRLPTGSATTFNNTAMSDMSNAGTLRSGARLLTNPLKFFGDKFENWAVGNTAKDWARVLFTPEGEAILKKMAVAKPGSEAMRTLIGGLMANNGISDKTKVPYEDAIGQLYQ